MLLRDREFRLLFAAQGVSAFGDRMQTLALAFAVLETGGSPSDVGLVLGLRSLPLVLCLLFGGVVADRTSRRTVLVVSDLVCLVSQGALAILVLTGAPGVLAIGLLAGVGGAATGFSAPATTGLLPEVVAPQDLQQANGLRATVFSAGELGGPLLAGLLVAAVGPGWALAVDAATFAVSAALLLALRLPARAPRAREPFLADLRAGWTAFTARRWLWAFVLWASFANVLFGAWLVLGPVIADRELGGAGVWGAILAAQGAGTVVGGALALRVSFPRPMLVCGLTALLVVPPLAALAATETVPLIAAAALLGGVGLMLGNTVWETTLQREVPAESLSRVSAYDWLGSLALDPVGRAIWGPLAVLLGLTGALWLACALALLSAVLLLLVPEIRSLRSAA